MQETKNYNGPWTQTFNPPPTFALAAKSASIFPFTLASTTDVTFYIPDNSSYPNPFGFGDNTGGVSLDVKAATPEPSSLILLGTGVLGLTGAASSHRANPTKANEGWSADALCFLCVFRLSPAILRCLLRFAASTTSN